MSKNEIVDINKLSQVPFKNLEKLELFDNQIEEIDVFKNTPFNATLKGLDLSFNKLKSVDALNEKEKFGSMTELKIEANDNLDYSDKKIQQLYDNYNITYTFNSIF